MAPAIRWQPKSTVFTKVFSLSISRRANVVVWQPGTILCFVLWIAPLDYLVAGSLDKIDNTCFVGDR